MNGCPVCGGWGRVLAFGIAQDPTSVPCPECAGLAITPGSADDDPLRAYTAREITMMLLRYPALPAGDPTAAETMAGDPTYEAPAG